ncbi:hypothetical protein HAX54_051661, partial [Datura stramonium]|nr:hypothetical protein [Datura stramonium]
MSGFAKYLKMVLTRKLPREKEDIIPVTHRVNVIIVGTRVEKKGDPGEFIVPCWIGRYDCLHGLYDNGKSINLSL